MSKVGFSIMAADHDDKMRDLSYALAAIFILIVLAGLVAGVVWLWQTVL